MHRSGRIVLAFVASAFTFGCAYIVLPEGLEDPNAGAHDESASWTAVASGISESEPGTSRIDLTIRNDTGLWSSMRAADGLPATFTGSDGTTSKCETVVVGTGGHRLAPGFQVRGFTSEEDGALTQEVLHVECTGVEDVTGGTLSIDYYYFVGDVDYYVEIEEANRKEGTLEVKLDEVATDLTYPVGTPVEGLIQAADTEITALSENIIALQDVQRTDGGMQFTWQNSNPSKFALKTHIGIPPVVGEDGIIYGVYETLDIPPVPLTPAQDKVQWTTDAPVPADVKGLYILLSVESQKPRTYANYAVDITDK